MEVTGKFVAHHDQVAGGIVSPHGRRGLRLQGSGPLENPFTATGSEANANVVAVQWVHLQSRGPRCWQGRVGAPETWSDGEAPADQARAGLRSTQSGGQLTW